MVWGFHLQFALIVARAVLRASNCYAIPCANQPNHTYMIDLVFCSQGVSASACDTLVNQTCPIE